MAGKVITVGLVCFLTGAAAMMFLGPWLHPEAAGDLPPCPYLESRGLSDVPAEVVTAIGAYEAIRETLLRESLEGVSDQAGAIARAFSGSDPKIAALAKRLAEEQDVESARRAFMRMHRLMRKNADRMPAAAPVQ